jgi:serine phosphatase RsbU (regulator of sigma subunit)
MSKRAFLYILLAALFLIASVYQGRFIQRRLQALTNPDTFVLNQIQTSISGQITSLSNTAEAAGLRKGDVLLAVEGRPYTGRGVLTDALVGKRIGDPLTVTIRRAEAQASEPESITFPIGPVRGDSDSLSALSKWLFVIVITIVMPIFCLLVGFWVAAHRPRDPQAWLLLGLLLSFAQMPTGFDMIAWKGALRDIAIVYHHGIRSLWAVFMLLFGIYFPERLTLDRRWPWAKWIFIAPLTAVAVANVASEICEARNLASVQSLNNLLERWGIFAAILQMIATGLFFTFIGLKMGSATSPDARRRLRMLLFGAQISLTPIFILVILTLVQGKAPLEGLPAWLILPTLLLLFLFPLTLAHVIVVQRAMDVSVVIRQGVRYAFARGGMMTLGFLIFNAIVFLTIWEIKKESTSLGPKQSEAPYSATDLKLLQSVAAQTGLAIENSQLIVAIAGEVAQRERLNREVEIAREVQERLFPQKLTPVIGLDYCGACRPALGVGGDYYDFLPLSDDVFGIAIGDVSGKGIAAALLMASLQASLRGQAMRGTDDLADMMRNVNLLVYQASSENRYATFFYAQYEPATRRLTYVNAGHNAPIILRKSDAEWQTLRLEEGGAVVGLLPNFPYTQATVQLEVGDLLLAFTDGISEAMNSADEEWGEERLIETSKSCEAMSAAEILARLVQGADEFAAGAPQHDDMTLIVVRVV